MGNIPFTFAGLDVALGEHTTKDDETKTYHCFGRPSMFGTSIPALEPDLPDFVVVDGIVLTLEHGLTAAEVPVRGKDGKPVKGADGKRVMVAVPEDERRPRASYEGSHELPSLGGEKRTVSVAISATKDGGWNVKATVNRKNLESPEERQARLHESAKKRQQSNLAAIMAALGTVSEPAPALKAV